MSEKFLGLTITWLLSWSIFAVDQLSTTIHYMNSYGEYVLGERSQETQQASAEKLDNQVNNSSTSEPDTEQSDENICSDEEFWSEVKAEIAPDRRNIILTFPSTPKETGIKSIEIVAKPTTLSYRTSKNAFHMHSIFQERLNTNKKEHEIKLNLFNGLDTKYTYLVTDWKLNLIASSKKSADCYESTFLKINKLNYESIENLTVFYKKNTISPFFEKNYDVREIGEDEYLNQYFHKLQLKELHKTLPKPHEAALSLLNKDVKYDFKNFTKGDEYVDEYISQKHRLHGEVILGLFGDVKQTDLNAINNLLHILNIVVPDLQISYSDNPDDVNLPIHFASCTKRFSKLVNDCKNKYAGLFYYPRSRFDEAKFGWIWVDSQYGRSNREHILIHELGHALGLGHNLCRYSVMSYADYADSVPYFTEVDLMQLRLLYDKKIRDKMYHQVIDELELDKELYSEYDSNKKPMCSPQQSGWEDFIEFQQERKTIKEILDERN